MKITKLIALVLCISMMMCIFTGCDTSVEDVIGEYSETEENARDFEKARATYAADEVVMTIDGEDITWDEFFNWICFALANYESTYGPVTDFSIATAVGNMSDTIVDEASYYILMYRAVEKKANELGVELAADIDKQMAEDWEEGIASFDNDEEALMDFITQFYGSKELYEFTAKMDSLSPDLFEHFFGAGGEKLTSQQLEEGSEGYMMAKHILIQTTDDATGLVLEEDAMKAAQEKIESIYAQLEAYEGDDLEGYFDELIKQYSEDEGSLTYPDGYLFQEGNMVNEFYNAAKSVEEGQFSEIVESQYGYHIVMRLPVDLDATPIGLMSFGYSGSLRYFIAQNLFSEESRSWMEELDVETLEAYEKIDLTQVFPA